MHYRRRPGHRPKHHSDEEVPLVMTSTTNQARVAVITAEDVAEVIAFAVSRPRRLAIHEVLLRPAGQEL
jgi:NADP-dependent 3-hydroxy acid dehydrogenase YdfG